MNVRALAFFVAVFACIGLSAPARAVTSCGFDATTIRGATVEAGGSTDILTRDRGTWNEQYIQLSDRGAGETSGYLRAASDERFGSIDPEYEGGLYVQATRHFILDAIATTSPTHYVLPSSSIGEGVDWRTNGGYGLQVQTVNRAYTGENANVTTFGGDRYYGDDRLAVTLSGAHLTNVPGTALSEAASFSRYLPCDAESYSAGAGRDVESTGVGSNLAVYKVLSFDANDVHWLTDRFGVNVGAGWYILNGAYNRLEGRFAFRVRL